MSAAPAFAQSQAAAHPDSSAGLLAAGRQEAQALADKVRGAGGALDQTPPALLKFDVSGTVDAQQLDQSVDLVIRMTDDLSGVYKYVASFRSPSGKQHVVRDSFPATPSRSFQSTVTVGSQPASNVVFNRYAEPGTWAADLFYAYDANGNFAGYSVSDLQRLGGSTTFQVVNSGGYDIVAPDMTTGIIATPHVRLSKPPKGMPVGTRPFVGASLDLTDSGNGAVSGVYSSRMVFCANDCAQSFVMTGVATATGLASATMAVGTQLAEHQGAGTYEIFALTVEDVAGNEKDYTSVDFGGNTDFSKLFPQGATVVVEK